MCVLRCASFWSSFLFLSPLPPLPHTLPFFRTFGRFGLFQQIFNINVHHSNILTCKLIFQCNYLVYFHLRRRKQLVYSYTLSKRLFFIADYFAWLSLRVVPCSVVCVCVRHANDNMIWRWCSCHSPSPYITFPFWNWSLVVSATHTLTHSPHQLMANGCTTGMDDSNDEHDMKLMAMKSVKLLYFALVLHQLWNIVLLESYSNTLPHHIQIPPDTTQSIIHSPNEKHVHCTTPFIAHTCESAVEWTDVTLARAPTEWVNGRCGTETIANDFLNNGFIFSTTNFVIKNLY